VSAIRVALANQQHSLKVDVPRIKRAARRVLLEMGFVKAELSLLLIEDEPMRRLNARYRSIDRPTDVLAFAMAEGPFSEMNPHLLGDVVISTETAAIQARRAAHSVADEVDALLVHGILHLIGYDHERSPAEARVMREKERRLLRILASTT